MKDSPEVTCVLRMPNQHRFLSHIKENARFQLPFLKHNQKSGSVAICGAGPSLKDQTPEASEIWGVNSALPYLKEKGLKVTHGFTIDQGVEMLSEWGESYDAEYYVASSVHPGLIGHLRLHGRKVSLFHNHLGVEGEERLYRTLYPTELLPNGMRMALRAGHGLNGVPRAVCIAIGMGYDRITVYGADSAALPDYDPMPEMGTDAYREWMKGLVLYADGRTAAECWGPDSAITEAPDLDGRRWHTRPDMVVSAIHLIHLQQMFPGKIEIVGDVLPNVLRKQPPEFWEDMPTLTPEGTITGFGQMAA